MEEEIDNPLKRQRRNRWGEPADAVKAQAPTLVPSVIATRLVGGLSLSEISARAAAARAALEKAKSGGPASQSISKIQKAQQNQMVQRQREQAWVTAQEHQRDLMTRHSNNLPISGRMLQFDRLGRPLDPSGSRLVNITTKHSTLKVNINREKAQKLKQVFRSTKFDLKSLTDPERNKWFDPSLPSTDKTRKKGLRFVERGYYTRQAEGGDVKPMKAPEAVDKHTSKPVELRRKDDCPEIEWWDAPLLKKDSRRDEDPQDSLRGMTINLNLITHYIEHPVPIFGAKEQSLAPTIHLTEKERKTLRRRKRQEKEREKQDKIRMGLIPPPPPKVKLSNLMRVLGDQAAADPSKIEKQVRSQMAQRLKQHSDANEARRLTEDERKRKAISKWQDKPSSELRSIMFALPPNLTDRRILFKVDRNAEQLHLTGVGVFCRGLRSLVVVEGGARSIKRYKRLMLRRICWNESSDNDNENDDDEDEDEKGACRGAGVVVGTFNDSALDRAALVGDPNGPRLVWEGVVAERSFRTWKVHSVRTEGEARRILQEKRGEHFWDMMDKFSSADTDVKLTT